MQVKHATNTMARRRFLSGLRPVSFQNGRFPLCPVQAGNTSDSSVFMGNHGENIMTEYKRFYALRQTLTDGRPARFSANGKRISRAEYERIFAAGNASGIVDCFHTECKQIGNGEFERINHVTVRY